MAVVCAGHAVGQAVGWKYSFVKTLLHILGFSHMEALQCIRLYNTLCSISYGDKVCWHAAEWLAKLYSSSL